MPVITANQPATQRLSLSPPKNHAADGLITEKGSHVGCRLFLPRKIRFEQVHQRINIFPLNIIDDFSLLAPVDKKTIVSTCYHRCCTRFVPKTGRAALINEIIMSILLVNVWALEHHLWYS